MLELFLGSCYNFHVEDVIKVENLKKHFGKVKAVDGISFQVKKGEIFGFLGPNGAGKTTVIRCLMDFLRPTSGKIEILGQNANRKSHLQKKKIGYLAGHVEVYDHWTGEDHIKFIAKLSGKKNIALKLRKRFDFDAKRKAKELSSGNRQKLGLILAFMNQPEVFIFDEPTNALDPLLQIEVYDMIKEAVKNGATVFMSSHNLAEVDKVCNRVGIIRQGKMAAVESISALKEKRIYTLNARFADNFKKEDFKMSNVVPGKTTRDSLSLKVKGDINAVLRQLSKYRLKDLEITPASIEDIFLEFYE